MTETYTDTEPMEELLRSILAAITQFTPNPEIETHDAGFAVSVHPDDQGRVVGRQGMTVWAINAVITYASLKHSGRQLVVRLLEPEVRGSGVKIPFRPNQAWDRSAIERLMNAFALCFDSMTFELVESSPTQAMVVIHPVGNEQEATQPHMNVIEAMAVLTRAAGMARGVVLDMIAEWDND